MKLQNLFWEENYMEKNVIGTLGEKQIVISKHAYSRMKERNGWNKKAAKRMIEWN